MYMTGFIEWILGSETAANWNPEQYPFSNAADLMRSMPPCDPFEKWEPSETSEIVPDRILVTDNRFKLLLSGLRNKCTWLDSNKFHPSRIVRNAETKEVRCCLEQSDKEAIKNTLIFFKQENDITIEWASVRDMDTLFRGCRYEKGTFVAEWGSTLGLVARKNKTVLGITEMPFDNKVRIQPNDMNSILSQILEANFNESLSMSISTSSLRAF